MLKRSLKESIAWLRKTLGDDPSEWQWGKIHTNTFSHPLAKQPPLGAIFNVGPFPAPGDNDTPFLTIMDPTRLYNCEGYAPSCRHMFDMSNDVEKAWGSHGPGQSGQLGSKHYSDTAGHLMRGEFFTIGLRSKEQLKRDALVEDVIILAPKK